MKRFTFSVVVAAVLGLAAYALADAQSARRGFHNFDGGPFFQQRAGPGGRAPGPGRGGLGFGLRGLDLTEDQRTQIKAIHDEARQARQGPPADTQVHRLLQTQLFADTPDPEKIAALKQQLLQTQAERLAQQIAIEQKIAQVLTTEQRAQLRESLAKGPGERPQQSSPR